METSRRAESTPTTQPVPAQQPWRYLLPVQPVGKCTPLFCAHGTLRYIARHIGKDQPLYGLRPHGMGGVPAPRTLEEMARRYLEEVRAVQPHGPYRLGGYSAGGVAAFEMAHQLMDAGENVEVLILLDPTLPRDLSNGPNRNPRAAWWHPPRHVTARARWLTKRVIVETALRVRGRVPRRLRRFHYLSTCDSAIRQFNPRQYTGRVVVLRTRSEASNLDPTLGCGQFVTGNVESHEVPGDHHDMLLDAAYAPDLARVLLACLNANA